MTSDQQSLVQDLLGLEGGLSDWEIEFLESLNSERWERELTDKQLDKLHDIARKKRLID